jgi:hypothetical protein
MLHDMLEVVGRLELGQLFSVGAGDADRAVVEIDVVALVHEAHVIGVVGEAVTQDQVDVGLVAEDDLVEEADGELGELDRVLPGLENLVALLAVHPLAHPPGESADGVNGFAAHHLDELMAGAPHADDLAADFDADLVDDAEDVALGRRGVRAHDEVRPAQGVKMGGVVGDIEDDVKKLP